MQHGADTHPRESEVRHLQTHSVGSHVHIPRVGGLDGKGSADTGRRADVLEEPPDFFQGLAILELCPSLGEVVFESYIYNKRDILTP